MNKILKCPYKTLVDYDGLYESPKDENGNYKGPLVAYAGIEKTTGKNWVGFCYYNIAKVEQPSETRAIFAKIMAAKIKDKAGIPQMLIGAPMGGIILAVSTADQLHCDVAFFEKKTIKLADPVNNIKEESELVFNRHNLNIGYRVILFEDICNNFSTTDKMIEIIKSKGGVVSAIACIVNRSPHDKWKGIPVLSAIHINTPEYSQIDPKVSEMIETENIIWKPKAEWDKLKQAMKNG